MATPGGGPRRQGLELQSPFLKPDRREGREELEMRRFTYKALQL